MMGFGGLAGRAVADRDVRSPARGLATRCVGPGDLMGRRARGVIDRRQRLVRCDAKHDGLGMVENLTEGDGGWIRGGEYVGGCLGHLPELVGGEVGGRPGQERGHVQPCQRGHVQAVESC